MCIQSAQAIVDQLHHAGLNISLAPAGGLAVAPSSHLTVDLRDLIRSSKALLVHWLTAANDAVSYAPTPPNTPVDWRRPTTPITSTARLASPLAVVASTGSAAGPGWRCGERIPNDLAALCFGRYLATRAGR